MIMLSKKLYWSGRNEIYSQIVSLASLNRSYVSCVIPNVPFGIHRPKLWATIKMTQASF